MARKYHPDAAKDKSAAEDKFKQIVAIAELILRVLKQMHPHFPRLSFDLKAISVE